MVHLVLIRSSMIPASKWIEAARYLSYVKCRAAIIKTSILYKGETYEPSYYSYLKSPSDRQNIITSFASYLKIASDTMQFQVRTLPDGVFDMTTAIHGIYEE